MDGKKRESRRELADYFECGGPLRPGCDLTYEDYVGVLLNKHRILTQRSVSFLAAINAATDAPLDESWADAVADDRSEIEEILSEANRQRAANRARKPSSRGPFG